ncbi:MAG: DNA-directed RNA polymerase subunit L [Candidatus Diapherotrites archaeon]|nr:DNA-directed RNA polymerase subunit L [Candidatus Diapherotrites archaeon]
MELELVKEEKNYLEFFLKGERYTFPNLLKSRLMNDSAVTFVSNKLDHFLLDKTHFVLRTDGKSPRKAIEDAIKEIEKDLSDFEREIKKALK